MEANVNEAFNEVIYLFIVVLVLHDQLLQYVWGLALSTSIIYNHMLLDINVKYKNIEI